MDNPHAEPLNYDEIIAHLEAVEADLDRRRERAVIAEYKHWNPDRDKLHDDIGRLIEQVIEAEWDAMFAKSQDMLKEWAEEWLADRNRIRCDDD